MLKSLTALLEPILKSEAKGVVLLIIGAALLVLGASGGSEKIHLTVNNPVLQYWLSFLGTAVVCLGAFLVYADQNAKPKSVDPSKLGVEIDQPSSGESLRAPIRFAGKCKNLPKTHSLWLFATTTNSVPRRYWPREEITVCNGRWSIDIVKDLTSMQERRFGIFVVGPDGQVLIEYYKRAGAQMDQINPARKEGWPGIEKFPADMSECDGRTFKVISP